MSDAVDTAVEIVLAVIGAGSIFLLLAWDTATRHIRTRRENS